MDQYCIQKCVSALEWMSTHRKWLGDPLCLPQISCYKHEMISAFVKKLLQAYKFKIYFQKIPLILNISTRDFLGWGFLWIYDTTMSIRPLQVDWCRLNNLVFLLRQRWQMHLVDLRYSIMAQWVLVLKQILALPMSCNNSAFFSFGESISFDGKILEIDERI